MSSSAMNRGALAATTLSILAMLGGILFPSWAHAEVFSTASVPQPSSATPSPPGPPSTPAPQAGSAEILPLEQAIKAAKDRSPDIGNLKHQVLAAEAQARLALAPQDPVVSLNNGDTNQAFDWQTECESELGITQAFNFPGEALISYSATMDQAKSLRSQMRAMEMTVASNVKAAYYQLALARKNIDLNKEQEKILEQIVSIVKRRYEAGSVTEVDVANSQMSQYQNQVSLADLVLAAKSAQIQLNVMLGRPAESDIEVQPLPDPSAIPAVDRTSALEKMARLNPQIQSNEFLASLARKNYTLAWMGLLPNFTVGVSDNNYYLHNFDYVDYPEVQTHSLNVTASVPLWFFLNESQNIAANSHARDSAQASLDSQVQQSKTALFTAIDTLEDNAAKLVLYKDHLLPLSEMTLKLALTNYGTGKIQFEDLAAAAAGLWSNRSAYFTLLQGYVAQYTQYGQLVGEEL
jgi:cobalt-zinc-cadmium efflux system outer membrane protein